jgi:iron complex outermembrane recepter protein
MSGFWLASSIRRHRSVSGARQAQWLVAFGLLVSPLFAAATSRHFQIPAGDAVTTLRVFSQQSGEQILYPAEHVRGIRTQRVAGRMSASEALQRLLARTGLVAVQDPASGAIAVTRSDRLEALSSAPDTASSIEPPSDRDARPTRGLSAEDVVMMTAFEVRSDSDFGYKAVNAASATRMALSIAQLPMSITAFTEEFIADQKAYDLYDIVKWAPGVHQDNVSPQGWVRYNIRGFTSAAVQRNGFASFRFIDTTTIARVEVIRGPSSLLYGQINPGGVINYITKRPEARPAVRTSVSVGDHGYTRAMLDATGPVYGGEPKLFYRAIAMHEHIQRFQAGARGEKIVLAPSLTWKISDRAALTLEYEHFKRAEDMLTSGVVLEYVNGLATVPYPGLPWDFSYAGEGDYQDFVSDALTVEFTATFGESINLRAAFLDSTWDMEWRATGQGGTGLVRQSAIDAFYPPDAGLTPEHAMFRRNRWEHQWGGERTAHLDVLGRFSLGSVKLDALAGTKWNFATRFNGIQKNNPNVITSPLYLKPWDLRNPATWDRRVPFGIDDLTLTSHNRGDSRGSALYGVVAATLWDDRVHVLAGYARHEVHNQTAPNFVTGIVTPPSDRAANVPQAGTLFKITRGVSGFVSYSESFLANPTLLRVNNEPMLPAEPAIGRGWEAGFKLDLLQGRISGTASVYRIHASPTGVIVVTTGLAPDGTTMFSDIQGGSQLSKGFEFDLLFTPTPDLQIIAAFSRCDAIYQRHPSNRSFDGSPLVATPDRTINLWAKYFVPNGPVEGLVLAGGVGHVGSMTHIGNNPLVTAPSYTTIDLSIGYRFAMFGQPWLADLSVKNAANERYYASASSWGFPRHAIVSLSTRF